MGKSKKKRNVEPNDPPPEIPENQKHFLNLLSQIIVDQVFRECELEGKLKQLPNGFHLEKDNGGTCKVCGEGTSGENSWYDSYGIKCISCQGAIDTKVIPAEIVKDDFVTLIELELDFSVSAKTARNWIKKGIVKSRIIVGKEHKPDLLIFLRSDNENFFPPKDMLGVQMVYLEPKNEAPYYTWLEWYHFCDVLEYLKDYGIVHHLGEG